jgi:dienelactone hydrolase
MGFSHGGGVALAASHAAFARLARVHGVPDFAAFLMFYPLSCNARLLDEGRRVGGPMRIFHGAADDWTPARPCRELVQRLRAGGHQVTMIEYDAAHHGFDARAAGPIVRLPDVLNLSQCVFIQRPDGGFVTEDSRPVARDAPCITRGATIGYNAVAHRKSIADVQAFLAEALGKR